MRVPDLSAISREPAQAPTLADAVAAYRASRIDIAENTHVNIGTSLNTITGRLTPRVRSTPSRPQEIADAVAELHASGSKRETIRKAVTQLACVFDFAAVEPNPCATSFACVFPAARFASPSRRAPNTSRPSTGCCRPSTGSPCSGSTGRAHESRRSTRTTAGDDDEPPPHPPARRGVEDPARALGRAPGRARRCDRADAAAALGPQSGKTALRSSGAGAIRTSIAKTCRAAGVPLWSPHDLRRRRISLLHHQGRTWAEIGALVGQRSPKVTSDTYTHVLVDGRELDYPALLARP